MIAIEFNSTFLWKLKFNSLKLLQAADTNTPKNIFSGLHRCPLWARMWTVCQSLSFAVIHLYPHINLIYNLRNPSDSTRSRTLIFWISKGSHPFRWRECIAMSTRFSVSYFVVYFSWWQILLICSLSVVTIALENRILEWTWTRFRINLNRLQKSQGCKTESKRPGLVCILFWSDHVCVVDYTYSMWVALTWIKRDRACY